MFGKRSNSIPNPAAPAFASYHQQPMPSPGAQAFVFDKLYAYPLQFIAGGGVLVANQMDSFASGQLDAVLAVPNAPIWGSGVPSGTVLQEPLLDLSSGDSSSSHTSA